MNATELITYNVWTDPTSIMFYGFCGVFLMTHVKPLLEMILKDILKNINQKVKHKQ